MGVSTDAILFYGYCWSEEGVELTPKDKEWEEAVLRSRGVVNPWDAYPPENERLPYPQNRTAADAWSAEHRAELDAWYDAKEAVRTEFGCEIGRHCSGEYSMPFVCVSASEHRARRGYPIQVDALTVGDGWDEQLAKFMAAVGISKPDGQDGPRWWLVSYWSQ